MHTRDGVGLSEDVDREFGRDEVRALDSEGRCVMTRHRVRVPAGGQRHLVLFNVYCPRGDPERADRRLMKMKFYRALDIRASALRERGDFVVIVGDINTSHRPADHCDPSENFGDNPGRRFLDHFLRPPPSDHQVNNNSNFTLYRFQFSVFQFTILAGEQQREGGR